MTIEELLIPILILAGFVIAGYMLKILLIKRLHHSTRKKNEDKD